MRKLSVYNVCPCLHALIPGYLTPPLTQLANSRGNKALALENSYVHWENDVCGKCMNITYIYIYI